MDLRRSMESTLSTGLVIAILDTIGIPLGWAQGLGMAAIATIIIVIITLSESGDQDDT